MKKTLSTTNGQFHWKFVDFVSTILLPEESKFKKVPLKYHTNGSCYQKDPNFQKNSTLRNLFWHWTHLFPELQACFLPKRSQSDNQVSWRNIGVESKQLSFARSDLSIQMIQEVLSVFFYWLGELNFLCCKSPDIPKQVRNWKPNFCKQVLLW